MSDPDANWREHCDWLADGWDECRDEVARLAEAERLLRLWERWDGMEDGVPAPHYDTHVWLQGADSATHRENEHA